MYISCRLYTHTYAHTYVWKKKKTLWTYFVLYVSNSSRPTFIRKRGQCTTERVCEPTPAERVARVAEIPDRTSYRYDTSSESFFPHQAYSLSSSPLCPLDHSPILYDFSSPRCSGPLCIFCLNSYTSFGIQVIYAHIHCNICPTMNFVTERLYWNKYYFFLMEDLSLLTIIEEVWNIGLIK